jgi:tripartite ATP-independent transporter DctP family solute receptor
MRKATGSAVLRVVLRFAIALVVTAAGVAGTARLASAATELKFHHDLPEDSAQHLAAVKFKNAVESRTHGEIQVKIFPNNALGDDVEATQQMQFGALQAGIIPTAKLSNFVPALQLVDLPFLFPSPAVAHKVLDSAAGDKLLATLDKVGLKGVTFWESGFKQFTCNHPVKGPADFHGYKVRVMQSPIIMEQFKALGANPVPISFGETYNALQQHVVECQENPLVSITKMKFYEVQTNMIISNHAYLGYAFVFSKKWFDGLKPEYRKILVDAAREMTPFEREETARREAGYVETIRKSGTTVTELTPGQLEKFREATSPVQKKFADQIGQDLLDTFSREIKAAGKK